MISAGDNSQAQIRSYVDRILRLKEEQSALAADVRDIYAEAKGNGFDKTALGQLVTYIAKRAKGEAELEEREAMFDLYLSAYDHNAPRTRMRMREDAEPVPSTGDVSPGMPSPMGADADANEGGENVTAPQPDNDHKSVIVEKTDGTTDGLAEPALILGSSQAANTKSAPNSAERTPVQAIMDTVLANQKTWKHSDPAHPDCLNPSGCGGFSNLKLCERCAQAADLGQVA